MIPSPEHGYHDFDKYRRQAVSPDACPSRWTEQTPMPVPAPVGRARRDHGLDLASMTLGDRTHCSMRVFPATNQPVNVGADHTVSGQSVGVSHARPSGPGSRRGAG